MSYTKTVWQDRQVQKPMTFTQTTNGDGTVTLAPSEGTITQPGTPITAAALNNLETQYDNVMTDIKVQPPWINAVMQNSWVTNDSTPLAYQKDNMGYVHIRGSITGGGTANGTVIATLPAGYRPQFARHYNIAAYTNTTYTPCEIVINTDGTIVINAGSGVWYPHLDLPEYLAYA